MYTLHHYMMAVKGGGGATSHSCQALLRKAVAFSVQSAFCLKQCVMYGVLR